MDVETELGLQRIVLIADCVEVEPDQTSSFSSALDQTRLSENLELKEGLEELGADVIVIEDPGDFALALDQFSDWLVFPNWMGERSRSRAGLIPAICEATGTRYVGADAYTRIVCGDKVLSRVLAKQAGFTLPKHCVCALGMTIGPLFDIEPPYVVKPSRQNSSIGISTRSLCSSEESCREVVATLQEEFQEPILVEKFIPGKEVSISMTGNPSGTTSLAACERYVIDDELYFESALFSLELKKYKMLETRLKPRPDLLTPDTVAACERLFRLLGCPSILRIDGRAPTADQLTLIEISPNPLMTMSSEYLGAFLLDGRARIDILHEILSNSLTRWRR